MRKKACCNCGHAKRKHTASDGCIAVIKDEGRVCACNHYRYHEPKPPKKIKKVKDTVMKSAKLEAGLLKGENRITEWRKPGYKLPLSEYSDKPMLFQFWCEHEIERLKAHGFESRIAVSPKNEIAVVVVT